MAGSAVRIVEARWPADRAAVESLFREYVESLAVDVSFQNVGAELANLPGKYARPAGVALMAFANEAVAGGGAYRMLEPGVCEMKRLYVRPAFRGLGIARELAEELIGDARNNGYRVMVLDTLESMEPARRLYARLGFRSISAYYDNPLPGATYLGLDL